MGLQIRLSQGTERVVYAFSAMALLLLLAAASPLMLKESIESALVQDAYAATDTTKPKVAITKPSNGSTLLPGTVQVTGAASDNSEGSGVGKVEVRIDKHSYRLATPKATGDWSTWSISFDEKDIGTHILSAKVTDKAGNQAWHSVSITVSSVSGGSSTDKFGVKMVYPTKTNGEQWFMDMADADDDNRFDTGSSITKNSDGSWKIKSSQVRMNVHTSAGYDPDDIDTYNQKTLATQGYMQSSKDWKNVEITGYVKFNSASDDNFSWYTRGGKHYDEDCEGTAYKGRLFYYSGETGFAKEQWHSGGYSFSSNKDVTSSIMDRWVGFKFIVYNTVQNGKTVAVLESWLNDAGDKTSSWKKVVSRVDSGGWGDEGDHCGGSADQIITWGGPITGFRWDRASDVDFKWLSVREIQPPS